MIVNLCLPNGKSLLQFKIKTNSYTRDMHQITTAVLSKGFDHSVVSSADRTDVLVALST